MFLAKPGTQSYLSFVFDRSYLYTMDLNLKHTEKPYWWALIGNAFVNEERDYTRGSLKQAVVLLAIPMMLEMSVEALFAITDIFFVAKLGAEAIATVGLTEAFITLLYAISIGFSMALTALIARRIGEKNTDRANLIAGQSILIGIGLSLGIGITGAIYAQDILAFLGASDPLIANYSGYTVIMLGGSATIIFLFIFNGIFRGAGDPVVAMRAIWLASGINIVLDPCLIFGVGPFPELGIQGAAIATNIGRGLGVLYGAYILCKGGARIQIHLRHLLPVPAELKLLCKVSIGGISQFLIATSSWIFLMKLMATFGSTALAGYTIAIRIIDFIILPAWGLSNSVSTLVGQNLGARNIKRAKKAVFYVAKYNLIFMIGIALVFIGFAGPIVKIFTNDAEIIAYATQCLRILSYGFGFYAVGLVMIQAFNGAGDTYTPTWINGICFWLFQIPFAYWLANHLTFGPSGIFYAILTAESLMALIGLYVFLRGGWEKTTV